MDAHQSRNPSRLLNQTCAIPCETAGRNTSPTMVQVQLHSRFNLHGLLARGPNSQTGASLPWEGPQASPSHGNRYRGVATDWRGSLSCGRSSGLR